MTMLVSLEEAKAHMRIDTDVEDDDITLKIHAASAAVLNYLKDTVDSFVDSSGDVVPPVPFEIKAATLLMLGALYGNRGEDGGGSSGFTNYLPPAVTALLYPLRTPTVT